MTLLARLVPALGASLLALSPALAGERNPTVQPIVGSFSYNLDVVARPGKPVRAVSAIEPPAGRFLSA